MLQILYLGWLRRQKHSTSFIIIEGTYNTVTLGYTSNLQVEATGSTETSVCK